jgi:hypothetical protein
VAPICCIVCSAPPADVMRSAHAVGTASESAPEDADRLLSYVLDGLRPPRL